MNEYGQGKYMDIGVAAAASKDEIEFGVSSHVLESEPGLILPSSSTNSLLGLPEMPLQPSISSEVELLDGIVVERHLKKEKGKALDVEQEDAQSKVDASLFCQGAVMENNTSNSKGQSVDQIKRTRTAEVHNTSERTRRDKIKRKIKTLQELMPHCRKKDRASILEDAANYVKSLKLQVEMMVKAREGIFLAQYMPCVATPRMQFPSLPPKRPGIGMAAFRPSVCASCSTPCAQWMPFPPAASVHPFAPSTLASFPFATMCPTAVLPTDGNKSNNAGETEQPETGIQSGIPMRRSILKQQNI